jgi:DivIVA domain-containing protein
MASIMYTPKDIFEQEFKTSMRGYDKKEVDEFLDDVIKDYEVYASMLNDLKAENESLKAQLRETKSMASAPVANRSGRAETTASVESTSNYDILKRISRLEKEVFGKQIANQ